MNQRVRLINTLIVISALIVTLIFAGCAPLPTQYTLTIAISPIGGGTVTPSSGAKFNKGAIATLTPAPAAGYAFKEWSGTNGNEVVANKITMNSNKSITAVFQEAAKWNFLVYLDGDNNLEEYSIKDFNEMEQVGSTSNVNVFVLFDRNPLYNSSNGNWTGARLYKVTEDTNTSTINSTLLQDYGELDMSDPNTLKDFVVYCQQNYPAQHTALTLWDHGGGVYPRGKNLDQTRKTAPKQVETQSPMTGVYSKGICWDDTTGNSSWNCLTTDEVAAALADARAITGKKIEIINMDACLMQMIEVAYEWKNETEYLVGSEPTVPGDGNDYTAVLNHLTGNPDMNPEQFAITLVDDYYNTYNGAGENVTYSAIKLGSAFDTLISHFNTLATALKNTTDRKGVYNTWDHTSWFDDYYENNDLYDFANELTGRVTDINVINAATTLKNDINNTVIHHREIGIYASTASRPAHGLAMLLPRAVEWPAYSGADQYNLLQLCQDTNWDEFIGKFVEYTTIVGSWTLNYYWRGTTTITFYGNGNFTTSQSENGTWSLNGNTITWVFSNGTTYTGAVDFTNETMTGTMVSNIGTPGDWNASKQ